MEEKNAQMVEWKNNLEAYQKSGLSLKRFCAEKNLSYNSAKKWRQRMIKDEIKNRDTSSYFIPVQIKQIQEIEFHYGRYHFILKGWDIETFKSLLNSMERSC